MSERISKLILETEFKTTGDLAPSVEKLQQLQSAAKAAKGDTLQLVEAEKQLERAAAQAGTQVETQTKKTTEFNKTIQGASKALTDIAQTNSLKKAFGGANEIANVNKLLKEFEVAARGAKTIDELTASVEELMAALPEDMRADAFKLLEAEAKKLDKAFASPIAELRELKKLISQETDPVVLKKLNERAGELKDQIGDTNDLIQALSSDTFFTDTLVEGAQVAVGAFTAFQGALSLVTDDQEELAKAAQKAQGALALLQGTQAILNDFKKSDNILTRAQIVGQKLYTAAVGESVGAQKAFRVALLATGIGALIVAIGLLAANWDKVRIALGGATAEQQRNNDAKQKSIENSAEEIAQLEIAKTALNQTNISQERRVAIIEELQQQYPEYLGNINAETVSNEELFKSLGNVNNALLLKYSIQAREAQLIPLITRVNELDDELDRLEAIEEQLLKNAEAQTDFNGKGREGLESAGQRAYRDYRLAAKQVQEVELELAQAVVDRDSVLKNIEGETVKLLSLQTNPVEKVKQSTKAVKEERKVLEGTIEFLEKVVSDLSNKVNRDLKIGSDEFVNTIAELEVAQKRLADARALFGTPTAVELFTEGSLNDLNAQVSELQKVINDLPKGTELEAKAQELRTLQEKIKELQDIINGPQSVEEKRQSLLEILNEEERYQQESLSIQEAGELDKLAVAIKFQKERLDILRADDADQGAITQAENDLDLLQQRYEKLNETVKDSNKQLVQTIVDGFKEVVFAALDAARTVLSIQQEQNDGLISLQQQRVEQALEIADQGNAATLEAEQERLAQLEERSREFARKQIALTQLQITAESALAIAKAAAQGGVAAPFTIAATLIALAAGYAQARAQASSIGASFRKGGYTGDGDPNAVSSNLGNKGYEYHKGEYVMPYEVTSIGRNKDWFEKIRANRINLETIMNQKSPTVIVNTDSKDVVKAIERIPAASFSFDKNGILRVSENANKVEAKRQFIKRRRK
jgi:hypothetical protein